MKYLEIKLLSVNAKIPKRANPTDSGLEPLCIRNDSYTCKHS